MDKNKIKSHLQSFLGEAEKVPNGLSATKPVQDKEAKVNKKYYKDVTKKMAKYEKDTTTDADSISAGDIEKTSSEEKDVNFNGMDQIQYDNDPSKQFKQRAIDALEGTAKMGNETYEGKWDPATGKGNGNTEEVWGASGGKHTGKEIVKNAVKNSKKDARPQEDAVGYVPQKATKTKLAVENKENNNEIIKENKMEKKIKRATFKQPFNGIGKALAIIPEGYKVDGNVFEMTDGNEKYRMRWEGTLEEGQAITLIASDKSMMNEDIIKMKHLMGFKASDTLGTPTATDRINENSSFRDIMDLTNKILTEGVTEDGDRKPINETAFAGGAGMGFTAESNMDGGEELSEEEITEVDITEGKCDKCDCSPCKCTDESVNESTEEVTETEDVTEGEEVAESKGITPTGGGENTKIGDTAQGDPRGAGHDKHVMEEDVTEGEEVTEVEVTEGEEVTEEEVTEEVVEESFDFDAPTIYKLSESSDTQNMAAGTDLGTKIGATASGDPRGEGHDQEIMEDEKVTEGEEITEEDGEYDPCAGLTGEQLELCKKSEEAIK